MNEPSRPQLNYRDALAKASEICSRSEKCCLDIELKCREWQVSSEDTTRLTAYLKQEKFIDHQRYATSFVNDKFRFNQWGRIKISYALRQKHIEESHIREALAGLQEEEYQSVLMGLLTAKARSVKDKDPYTRRGKLLNFALSRGFESEEANRVINRMN